jgi:YfiH family protein
MWKLENGCARDTGFPCAHLVTTREFGSLRDSVARRAACAAGGWDSGSLIDAEQVHGTQVVVVTGRNAGMRCAATDGLITADPAVVLGILTADCLPVFLAARDGSVAGVVHAGWRGLAGNIIAAAIDIFTRDFTIHPSEIIASIGPHVRKCCYTPGAAARQAFAVPATETHLDLTAVALRQLQERGVSKVSVSPWCTQDEPEVFYSYRRDGTDSRMMSLVAVRPAAGMTGRTQ